MNFTLTKRGGGKSFSHAVQGGGGARKVLPCLEGGGAQKVSDSRFSYFVAPPLPVINDQSLRGGIRINLLQPLCPS